MARAAGVSDVGAFRNVSSVIVALCVPILAAHRVQAHRERRYRKDESDGEEGGRTGVRRLAPHGEVGDARGRVAKV